MVVAGFVIAAGSGCSEAKVDPRQKLVDALVARLELDRVCVGEALGGLTDDEALPLLDLVQGLPAEGLTLSVESLDAYRAARACPTSDASEG